MVRSTRIGAVLGVVLAAGSMAGPAQALCVATTRTLVQFGVWQCQPITLGGNRAGSRRVITSDEVRGTLLTGMVLSSRSVLEAGRKPPSHLFEGPALPANQPATVFIAQPAAVVCRQFKNDEAAWLVSARMCCDTLPPQGPCLLPDTIPVAELTRPEGWRDHPARKWP